ncbi:MAG: DUF6049 family protein [Actinomycetota bacterium]
MTNPGRKAIALALLMTATFTTAKAAPPVAIPTAIPALNLNLIEFPAFVGPADSLRLVLEVTNPDKPAAIAASGLSMTLSFHDRVRNRSTLKRTFDAKPAFGPEIGTEAIVLEGTVEVGQTRQFTINKPLAEFRFFRTRTASGAYPLQIGINRTVGGNSASISTHLVYFVFDGAPRLGICLVVPLHSPPIYADSQRPDSVTSNSLERSIDSGRISNILDALEASPDTAVSLAPSGLLLDTLADLADGFITSVGKKTQTVGPDDPRAMSAARTLLRIRALATRSNTEIVLFPYSAGLLPALVRADLPGRAQAQIAQGGDDPPAKWFLPVGGLVDEATLTLLQQSSLDHTILSPMSLRVPGDPLITRPEPVQIKTRTSSPTTALITDLALSERLLGSDRPIIFRQRFLAETLTVMLEFPGQTRAVVATAPANWAPHPVFVKEVFDLLSRSPWLVTTTPTRMNDGYKPSNNKPFDLAATNALLDKALPSTSNLSIPPAESFTALKQAQTQIKRYAELDPPRSRLSRLDRQLLISESSDWWTSRARMETGKRFATAVPSAIKREFDAINAPAKQTITLTSRTGVIPLSIRSGLNYPVDLVVRLRSSKLSFPARGDVRPCNATDRNSTRESCIFLDKLPPRSPPIEVFSEAQATGTFALHLLVETPGGFVLDESDLIIQSTAYSGVAVAITAGAAFFLLVWWIGGLARKRAAT